jgi:hypothetical protein
MTDIMLGDLSLSFSINVDEKTKCIKFLSASVPFDSDPVAQLNSTESLLKELFGSPDIVEDELDSEFFRSKKILWFCTGYKIELSLMFLSSSTFLKMNVEQYSESKTDFRVAKWGDSKEEVMAKEGKTDLSGSPDIYMFYDTVAGLSCVVGYVFTDDKLTMAKYLFQQKHTNKNDYIEDYNKLVGLLTKKYGEPYSNSPFWKNTLYKSDPSQYGFAISCGHLLYSASWDLETTELVVRLTGENFDISFQVQYLSKKYKNAQKEQQEQKDLDLL